jgi:hypothetical protein
MCCINYGKNREFGKQEAEAGMAPLTTTPSDPLEDFVFPIPKTFIVLEFLVPKRDTLSPKDIRIPLTTSYN